MSDVCTLIRESNISLTVREMVTLSEHDGMERGVLVYLRKGELFVTRIQKGESRDITLKLPSLLGLNIIPIGEPIGAIHTHPHEDTEDLFSLRDINALLNNPIYFSASAFDEGEDVVVGVFKKNGFKSPEELRRRIGDFKHTMELAEKANRELQTCRTKVGKKMEVEDVRPKQRR